MRFEEVASSERRVANRRDVAPSAPRFFVSVASKELRFPVNPLDATLMGIFASVASKGLKVGCLRPKTSKTRCLSASADSARLRENAGSGEKREGLREEPFDSRRSLRMRILRGMRKGLRGIERVGRLEGE